MMQAGNRLAISSELIKNVEESDPRSAVKGDRDPLTSIGLLHDLNIAFPSRVFGKAEKMNNYHSSTNESRNIFYSS